MCRKYLYVEVKEIFAKEDWILLSKEYKNNKQRLKVQCNKGHIFYINLNNFLTGRRCFECSGKRRIMIDIVRKEFKKIGYILLSNQYINCSIKLDYICNKGHKNQINYNCFQQGQRCSICQQNKKYTINETRKIFLKEKYILLSKKYDNNHTKLKIKCPDGHIYSTTLNNFQSGHRCKKCFKLYYRGNKHFNFKKGKTKCIDCGKVTSNYNSKRCQHCLFLFQINKNNPNWKNGISKLPYSFDFTSELKHEIRTRDKFTCQCCGMTEKQSLKKFGRCLDIHHINYNKQNCLKDNLITVCRFCNNIANGDRDYWYAYYKYIIDNKLYKEKI
jgi:hypothetical protein